MNVLMEELHSENLSENTHSLECESQVKKKKRKKKKRKKKEEEEEGEEEEEEVIHNYYTVKSMQELQVSNQVVEEHLMPNQSSSNGLRSQRKKKQTKYFNHSGR